MFWILLLVASIAAFLIVFEPKLDYIEEENKWVVWINCPKTYQRKILRWK